MRLLAKSHVKGYEQTRNGKRILVHDYDTTKHTHRGLASPGSLGFREKHQDRTAQVRELFHGAEYTPVATIRNRDGYAIIDGHNRATVAEERGHDLPFNAISHHAYEYLQSKGHDDLAIAWAIHTAEKEYEAADAMDQQFHGSNLEQRGREALNDLHELEEHEAEFVKGTLGHDVLGAITPELSDEIRQLSGVEVAPFDIKMRRGYHDDDGDHAEGSGEVHIEANHGDQIRNAKFSNAVEFAEHILSAPDEIWLQENGRLAIVKLTPKSGRCIVDVDHGLIVDEEVAHDIHTAIPTGPKTKGRGQLIWSRGRASVNPPRTP